MKKEDEEKTAFYTDHGTLCYQKMPFGLKNAGATYQRLVDRVFAPQIGRNIEVYVDDMVIKSRSGPDLLEDIQETLTTLERTKMKLNPSKCTFAVEEGQFLGYYITNDGKQPNPSKVKDLVETPTPTTLKDMQGLNGKLTALGRFVAKSAERAVPLFHTLKGDMNKGGFKWTPDADKAWQQLKKVLTTLPTLSSPIAGETLHDIEYRPRVSIKGQALADFLLEVPNTEGRQCNTITAPEKENTTWKLHTDGAAGKEGCGAGLILQSPQNEEMTYALRFDFQTSNNEAEYEALIAGLRLAASSRVKDLEVLSDSMLVSNQLASTSFDHLTKKVLVEVLKERSIEETQVKEITNEATAWMTPIIEYIKHGILPEDEAQARKIRIKAPQYSIMDGRLYKKGYLVPWLKCIKSREGQELLQETHSGDARAHEGAKALTRRVLRMGGILARNTARRGGANKEMCRMPNIRTGTEFSLHTANEHNGPLAVPSVGNRHSGPFPRSVGKSEVLDRSSRLLYEVDRGRTCGQHIRKVDNQVHVEVYPHAVRHTKNPNQ
ncbi:hypothetical protein L2E82_08633 [Cichorium intybus]|uniref:Uncharacterized protein n=1 Tax=Cichorium intybus TaxID=13427 RepID=A0ACB9G6H8_CICIN|nr:hypothetical protein L2E82_08633 [Cichorium intybus]